jgi:hypothetical protein
VRDKQPRPYEPDPRYPASGGTVIAGWDALAATLPPTPTLLALDGPAAFDWPGTVRALTSALRARGHAVAATDLRDHLAPWPHVVHRTGSGRLADDPDFERLADGGLADLFDALPAPARPDDGVHLVFGPGAALVAHDLLWYADLPKR